MLIPALRAARRAIRRRFTRRGIVLMYHRITTGVPDPWRLCVSPERFEQHLEVLRRSYQPVDLGRIAAAGDLPERAVAVTFDDGYADNLHVALPLLERYEIPATFFLTSGALGCGREFWWDELERLLLRPERLPPALRVTVGAESFALDTGAAADPFVDSRRTIGKVAPWEAASGTRVGFYYALWQRLRTLAEDSRRAALAQIREQLEEPEMARDGHRILTPDEAIRLARAPLTAIGAHSVTHAALPAQSPDAQRREMHASKRDLESLTGRPVVGFAYPYGDYAPATADLAREVGFEYACTTERGTVTRRTQPFLIPRLAVADCGGAEFGRYVEQAP